MKSHPGARTVTGQSLSRELIENRQQRVAPSIAELVVDEIDGPSFG